MKLAMILFTLLLPGMAVANNKGENETAASVWARTCGAISDVTNRAGRVSPEDIEGGIQVLQDIGLLSHIGKQTNEEACLSLIASGETGAPTFVINKPAVGTLPPAQNPAMPFAPLEQVLTEKLEALDLGYYVPAPGNDADPKYRELYNTHPKEAKRASWYSLMIQTRTTQRSLSAFFEGYCLIIQDKTAMSDYVHSAFRGDLSNALSDQDVQWLKENGNATEFWHEAAHCQLNPIGNMTQPQRTARVMANVKTFEGGCDSSFSEQVFNMTLGRQPVSPSELQAHSRDLRILYDIAAESYADDFAKTMLSKRMGINGGGCVSPEHQVTRPWVKFRLADSVKNPSIKHMTWLAPFLAGQSLSNQAHALADSWAALKEISFDEVDIPGKQSLIRKVLLGRSKGGHLTPAPEPDEERKKQWKGWINASLNL